MTEFHLLYYKVHTDPFYDDTKILLDLNLQFPSHYYSDSQKKIQYEWKLMIRIKLPVPVFESHTYHFLFNDY